VCFDEDAEVARPLTKGDVVFADENEETTPKDVGRPAEADAIQNKAPSEVGPDTEEKRKAREEFNLHEADLGRNPQG